MNAPGSDPDVSFSYDNAGRIKTSSQTGHSLTFDHNVANQIIERINSNSAYDYSVHTPGTDAYVANGLNQYTSVAGTALTYDGRGNVTYNGAKTFSYDYSNNE